MTISKEYTIKRTVRIYNPKTNRWERKSVEQKVTYVGMEGSKYVFETEQRTELLVHKDDLVVVE